jgi:hypothetical protein
MPLLCRGNFPLSDFKAKLGDPIFRITRRSCHLNKEFASQSKTAMQQHSASIVEILENRIAPAGIVTVAYSPTNGELTLTGDLLDNSIFIFEFGPNQHRVAGAPGTLLGPDSLEFMDVGKITNLIFTGSSGEDELTLFQLKTLTSVTFDGGSGDDSFNCDDGIIKGFATFNGGSGDNSYGLSDSIIAGNLTVNETTGGGDLSFTGNIAIGGSLLFNGGGGVNKIRSTFGSISIGKGLQMNGGLGSTEIELQVSDLKIGKLPTGESILINGGAGIDHLELNEGAITFAGAVRMIGGTGVSNLLFNNSTSPIKIGKLASGNSIYFESGAEADSFSIAGASIVAAGGIEIIAGGGNNDAILGGGNGRISLGKMQSGYSLRYTGGSGGDSMHINGSAIVFAGGIDFSGFSSLNELTINNVNGVAKIGKSAAGESIQFAGGSGNNSFTASSSSLVLAGGVDFAATGDNSRVTFGPSGRLTIGKLISGHSIKFNGGTVVSELTMDVDIFAAAGGIEFSAGNGENALNVGGFEGSAKIGKLSTGESIRYVGSSGGDRVVISPSVVNLAGGLDFAGGSGSNILDIEPGSRVRTIKIGAMPSGQSINYLGGSADDQLVVGGRLASKGSVEMIGGGGENLLLLSPQGGSIGKSLTGTSVRMTGGAAGDLLVLNASTVAGDVILDGGDGNDDLQMFGRSVKVSGNVTYEGGPGANRASINVSALTIAKSLTINGGDGGDTVRISSDGTIGGEVSMNLGTSSADPQNVVIGSRAYRPGALVFKQGLSIVSATTAAATDSVDLLNLIVTGAVSLDMGDGITNVRIDNLTARDSLSILTNGGADTVGIERRVFPGNSIVTKLATIQTGSGTDTLLIGSATYTPNNGPNDTTRVRFLAGLNADGGSGSDSANAIETENDFPGSPATITTFEVSIP